MKFLYLLLVFLLVPFAASAQTTVSKEAANAYFTNCIAQKSEQSLSPQAQNMLCACTAARMTQFFSMEDMATMTNPQSEPSAQRGAFNKMLIYIYAPCMEEPTREFHYNACMANPQTAQYGDPAKICRCMADEIATHIKINGSSVFEELIARNPNINDPMAALTDDPSFQTFAQSKLLGCLR